MAMRKNLSIMGIANLVAFVLSLSSVLIVSRLLTPMEIGVFSVSVAVMGLAHIFRDFGVGAYLIQAAKVGGHQFRAAFTVTLATSWLIAILLFLGRYPLAEFYDHQGVVDVLAVLSLTFLILPFGTPLMFLMKRDLEFNKLAWIMIFETLLQASVTVVCAYYGQSYMSMAYGSVAAHVGKILLLNMWRPGEIFIKPTFKGLGEVVRFGSISSMMSLVKELGNASPDLILGRTLGFVDVAIFSRAVGLKKMLIERLIKLVGGVYFPTLASKLREGEDGAKMYSQTVNYLMSVVAPVLAVLAIVSEPLILFMFGSQWGKAAPIASFICAYTIITTPYSLYAMSVIAMGKVELSLKAEVAIQLVKVSVLLSSIWLPLKEVGMWLGIAFIGEALFAQIALNKAFGLKFLTLFAEIRGSLTLIPLVCIGPALVMYGAHVYMLTEQHFAILALSGVLAGIGWLTGVFMLSHPMKLELLTVLHKTWRLSEKFRGG